MKNHDDKRQTKGRKSIAPAEEVEIDRPWPKGGKIWYGQNGKQHGGEFFIGICGSGDGAYVTIPDGERERIADFLARFVKHLRGQSK